MRQYFLKCLILGAVLLKVRKHWICKYYKLNQVRILAIHLNQGYLLSCDEINVSLGLDSIDCHVLSALNCGILQSVDARKAL